MDKIAVLIPCYNEGKTVTKVVTDWKEALPEATIYVYDNNSSDDTAILAEKAGAVVRHEYQQGKGNVIRRMFREIDAEAYLMVDGDDTYPAEFGRDMVDKVLTITRLTCCRHGTKGSSMESHLCSYEIGRASCRERVCKQV